MTVQQALDRINYFKGCLGNAGSLLSYKDEIADLYKQILGYKIDDCNCTNKYADAVIQCFVRLSKVGKMKEKATLKNGAWFEHNHVSIFNDNLTDDIARAFLNENPNGERLFAVLPDPIVENESEVQNEAVLVGDATQSVKKSKK